LARDPYLELGVSRSASAGEIRKAFHKLAKQHHPDTNPGNKAAEERFKQVSAAFDILGDVEKRKKFDAGEIDADGREAFRGFAGSPGGRPSGAGKEGPALRGSILVTCSGIFLVGAAVGVASRPGGLMFGPRSRSIWRTPFTGPRSVFPSLMVVPST